jgi:hypothetical protein
MKVRHTDESGKADARYVGGREDSKRVYGRGRVEVFWGEGLGVGKEREAAGSNLCFFCRFCCVVCRFVGR